MCPVGERWSCRELSAIVVGLFGSSTFLILTEDLAMDDDRKRAMGGRRRIDIELLLECLRRLLLYVKWKRRVKAGTVCEIVRWQRRVLACHKVPSRLVPLTFMVRLGASHLLSYSDHARGGYGGAITPNSCHCCWWLLLITLYDNLTSTYYCPFIRHEGEKTDV